MAPYKHSTFLNAAEMAEMITSAARALQSSDIHGMFGVIDEKAARWAQAYPQLSEAWQAYNTAFRNLGCTSDARQRALDELPVLAAAFLVWATLLPPSAPTRHRGVESAARRLSTASAATPRTTLDCALEGLKAHAPAHRTDARARGCFLCTQCYSCGAWGWDC